MKLLDKAIASVAPEWGLKRATARKRLEILNSGYSNYGASHTKKSLLGWLYGGGSANEDIQENLSTLRQRSRDLYCGVPLATGAIKTVRTNVVGAGLKLKSQVDREFLRLTEEEARRLEDSIEREWNLWAESTDCDIERLDNFYELQQLAFINWLLSGDVIVLLPTTKRANMPYDLRIRLIEADRVSDPPGNANPDIIGGIEMNKAGEVVAYHISTHHPLSWITAPETRWERIEAYGPKTGRRNVLHIMNRERIGQRRGVPFLAPVIDSLKQLGRYTDAELIAAVVNGMFTIFIEKEGASSDIPIGELIPQESQIDSADDSTIELAPGAVIDLNEGEKANGVNPGRPNAAFDGFVVAVSRQIGAALEIPYELLVKSFNSSYSASRGALLEAWKMFKMYRSWLANDFCKPIYNEWFAEAVAKGRISAPGFFTDPLIRKAYTGAEWNGPAQGLLNPVQEVQAAEKRVQNGFSTRDRETAELTGGDFYRNVQQLKQEEKLLKEVRDIAESETQKNKLAKESESTNDLEKVEKIINALPKSEQKELGERYFYDDAQFRYVEEYNGEPIGFIENRATGTKGHLNCAVLPGHRNKGVASKMIKKAIKAARVDQEKVYWITSPNNTASRNLAEKHGFELKSENDEEARYLLVF